MNDEWPSQMRQLARLAVSRCSDLFGARRRLRETHQRSASRSLNAQHSTFNHLHHRHGLSLLEVLISIFVVAIGLLSLMSLLPAAKSVLADAAEADRTAACGAAGLRMAEAYGLQNPNSWARNAWDPTTPWGGWNVNDVRSVCIDPVGVGRNVTGGVDCGSFPYASGYGPPASVVWGGGATVAMTRLSILPGLGASAAAINARTNLAARMFTWTDDRQFTLPEDETLRAESFYTVGPDGQPGVAGTDDDGNGITDELAPGQPDALELGWPGSDDVHAFGGDYTWMFTVTPDFAVRRNDNFDDPSAPDPAADFYQLVPTGEAVVSVVVFRGRVPVANPTDQAPSERSALAEFIDPLGKFVRLGPPDGVAVTEAYWRNLRVGQWIMLAAERNAMGLQSPAFAGVPDPAHPPMIARWYRIAGLGPIDDLDGDLATTADLGRDAVLAGPDWGNGALPFTALYADAYTGTAAPTVHVVIADSIVGVFEKTIPVENPSTWNW
jgi:hypothetical protein